jgi:hypothetical protein
VCFFVQWLVARLRLFSKIQFQRACSRVGGCCTDRRVGAASGSGSAVCCSSSSAPNNVVFVDARLMLGDCSAFDLNSLLLFPRAQAGASDLNGSSGVTSSLSASLSTCSEPSYVGRNNWSWGNELIAAELELPTSTPFLNTDCTGSKLVEAGLRVAGPLRIVVQMLPLLKRSAEASAGALAPDSVWHVRVLGVTGAL